MPSNLKAISVGRLRAGDWVEVRSEDEILESLQSDGTLEGMPFMPEMLKHCGGRFRISAIAHKTCDPAHKTGGRRLENAVHLGGLRCDGAAHGGCQAACLLFWKTDWLKPIGIEDVRKKHRASGSVLSRHELERTAFGNNNPGQTTYACQATRLLGATRVLAWWDIRQYVRDLTSRNVTLRHMARVVILSWARALVRTGIGYRWTTKLYDALHRVFMKAPAPIAGEVIPIGQVAPPSKDLHLRPGESVRIKSDAQIRSTLNASRKNRGLWFDDEMVPYCGGTHRVAQRVERIINEVTGEMMLMKSSCITLEGVVCKSVYAQTRLFCPRAITPYWREAWLERVDQGEE